MKTHYHEDIEAAIEEAELRLAVAEVQPRNKKEARKWRLELQRLKSRRAK